MCAPTGAGKTNVALLTILHEVSKRIDPIKQKLRPECIDFKCIYICPMKALAAEIVDKFQSKLTYLGIIARELTGDMQLSK
jgi:replicative superfamily II helicase